ncbi:unnamed protein product [Effrenium voratum]|uniref:Uncharacterized protein n=1 Tax=Effrenium voratum TaxID=2562239 RepID=A0AA36HS08_9DINO|nr:unnamed protein product [Effrenium voratum]
MNVNGRLCSFARSVAGGREHHAEAPLGAFASRWQLNERSRQVLAALPQEVLNTVMAEFRPAPGTASVETASSRPSHEVCWRDFRSHRQLGAPAPWRTLWRGGVWMRRPAPFWNPCRRGR